MEPLNIGPGHEKKPYPGPGFDLNLLGQVYDEFLDYFNDLYFFTLAWNQGYMKTCEDYLTYPDRGYVLNIGDVENLDIALEKVVVSAVKDGVIKTTRIENEKNGFFEAGDSYMAIADNEITYGATVRAEYSIHVNSNSNLKRIEIVDYLPDGWQCESTDHESSRQNDIENNTVKFSIDNPPGDETVVKVVLSKIITSADDVQELANTADVTVFTPDGNQYTTSEEKPTSTKISIIPPFGKQRNIFMENWQIIISCSIIALYFIQRKIKIINNK